MDLLEKYYGKRTFTLYALYAYVPGKRAWPRKIFVAFSLTVLTWAVVYQMIKLIVEKFKIEVLVDLFPSAVISVAILLYIPYSTCATEDDFKVLLSIMLNDLKEERSEEENAIKERYAETTRLFVNVYTGLTVMALCGILLSGFFPCFLDIVIPLNESRGKEFLFDGEMFIDQDQYFYHIYSLECCTALVIGVVAIVTEHVFSIIVQHASGMFAVVGYRLENLTKINECKTLSKPDYGDLLTNRIRVCIESHQKSLQFTLLMSAFFDIPVVYTLVTIFLALTITLVQVVVPKLFNVKMAIFTVVQVFHLFLVSYIAQINVNASEGTARNAYNAEWDATPPNVRKFLQLIMLRSSKPSTIVARGIYTLSIENFMSAMQTVTSFCMVLKHTI